jgi:hypothetical protein
MINEKKDACYHKVKSRYSVWPSAYASGALVKCRKKGAKNWGNSRKDEALHTAYFNFAVYLLEAEGSVGKRIPGQWKDRTKDPDPLDTRAGTGPNVPRTRLSRAIGAAVNKGKAAVNKGKAAVNKGKELTTTVTGAVAGGILKGREGIGKASERLTKFRADRRALKAVGRRASRPMPPRGDAKKGKRPQTPQERSPEQQAALDARIERTTPPKGTENGSKKRTDVGSEVAGALRALDREKAKREKAAIDAQNRSQRGTQQSIRGRVLDRFKDRVVDFATARGLRTGLSNVRQSINRGRDSARAGRERIQFQHTEYQRIGSIIAEKSAAWTRKAGKNPSGGLNAKGVASYRAQNPGSKLKTAVTTKPSKLKKGSKAANRRKSFCARMKGMRKRRINH